ncbi:hypothetical protein [Catellatospora citrea]|uniref:Uncharacterized protein n=1 Tax=Catellatospora citrea TaxID=53366 RepID=A0A8J3KJG4_9ACTN|nr:hypothetical protein [Catellatospora citrea]RKE10714.1 hypothetical protein C8E86_5631 [Catellatospora citrea]GIG01153.1 hypothetical protein Cci01nite_62460 [Catellatospora citrea]
MTNDAMTPSESAILIVLMAEACEVTNTDLKERYGLDVRKDSRDKLNRLRLVASRQTGRTYAHQLDDKGWARVQDDLNFDNPKARALGAALSALHAHLRDRVLPRTAFDNLTEMFSRTDITPQRRPAHVEARIRHAYDALTPEPGAWVALARLRPFFSDITRHDLDEALRQLARADDVNIAPESNQKTLTSADIAAALSIAGHDKHLLAIGV